MRSTRVGVAALAVLVTLAAPCAATAATAAEHHERVTPSTSSNVDDQVIPVVGSADALVYYVRHRYVSYDPVPVGTGQLVARRSSGRVVELGTELGLTSPYSLVHDTLSASKAASGTRQRVWWWDVASAKHGTIDLAAGDRYLTAAPGGIIALHGSTLLEVTTSGQTTTLAPSPFPADPQHPLMAVAGDDGLLVVQGTQAAYRADNAAGFTALNTGGLGLRCLSVVGGFAACLHYGPVPHPLIAILLALDGAAPLSVDVTSELIANSGANLFWVDGSQLVRRSYSSSTTTKSTRKVASSSLVSGLGGVVAADPAQVKLLRASAASPRLALLTAAKPSPVQANSFSFSPGQVVYNDDRRTSAPRGTSSTFVTAVRAASTGHPRPAATRTIRKADYPYLAARSGTTTVYVHKYHPAQRNETIVVRAPQHSTTIRGVNLMSDYGAALVSGNRVLYLKQRGRHPEKTYIYDVSTGRRTMQAGVHRQFGAKPALSGDYLAYLDAYGSVWRKNLATGKAIRLSPPITDGIEPTIAGQVYLSGNYVGWTLRYLGDDDARTQAGFSTINAYRNAKTMAPARSLPHQIYGLSDEGVVQGIESTLQRVTFSLHTYSGHNVALMNNDYVQDADDQTPAPQIQGRDQAWIGHTGVLRVAALSIAPARPLYLGAAVAPKTFGGHAAWRGYAPFSEPLTACSMTITHAGHTVATVLCGRADRSIGVARIAWNGTAHGRPVAAGQYHYAIHARGTRGRALKANGTVGLIKGTIRV